MEKEGKNMASRNNLLMDQYSVTPQNGAKDMLLLIRSF